MNERPKPRFVIGDAVVDEHGNIGIVINVTPLYSIHNVFSTYLVRYGILNRWHRDVRESALVLYASTER